MTGLKEELGNPVEFEINLKADKLKSVPVIKIPQKQEFAAIVRPIKV